MNDEIRQKILDVHNELRSLTARGLAKDKLGGTAPQAAAMYKLQYKCDLEKFAVAHASKCVYGHTAQSSRQGVGENIFAISLPSAERPWAGEMAVKSWFEELEKYGVGQENLFTDELVNRNNTMIGHYTQVSR
ncbi:SCP-like protein [Oesophagostomum dentatum]|uniref:SCP-like protein n=1 Tax=Oesophagostomum dentatum TaxID=61180 RepID=A0A0B1RWA2_OESDE|nr:SCP-like protein [Oesophagostomum dentatum]